VHRLGGEEIKLFLIQDDMIVTTEIPKESEKQKLKNTS
jgi:hypothetical protein